MINLLKYHFVQQSHSLFLFLRFGLILNLTLVYFHENFLSFLLFIRCHLIFLLIPLNHDVLNIQPYFLNMLINFTQFNQPINYNHVIII
jgi:hypothetical protein